MARRQRIGRSVGLHRLGFSRNLGVTIHFVRIHPGDDARAGHRRRRRRHTRRIVDCVPTDAAFPMTGAAQAVAPPPKKKGSRPFIPALDSTRFFLISYIAVGHFIACCTKNKLALAMLSQVNVVVGAFFVLSGYVVAYTCTELGKYEASPRIKPANQFIMSRIMGYYPLYLLAQLVFLPVFLLADVTYNGPVAAAFHGLLTTTLSQAWFPVSFLLVFLFGVSFYFRTGN